MGKNRLLLLLLRERKDDDHYYENIIRERETERRYVSDQHRLFIVLSFRNDKRLAQTTVEDTEE